MIWIITVVAIKLTLLTLYILMKIAERQEHNHVKPQAKPPTQLPHYGPPVLKPEWGTLKVTHPAPKQLTIQVTATIQQQRTLVVKPQPPALKHPSSQEIRSLASYMAAEANIEIDGTRWLYRMIMDNGGIRRYKSEHEPQEEYTTNVPLHYRRKNGLTPDEMAANLGFDGDRELYEEIQKSERRRIDLTANLPRNIYTASMFTDDATAELVELMNPHLGS